jgi:hypothetical protein
MEQRQRLLRTAYHVFQLMGCDPILGLRAIAGIPKFLSDMRSYKEVGTDAHFPLKLKYLFPVLSDYRSQAGEVRGHYFHQDLWAARKVVQSGVKEHMDVGSRIDGFVAHLLTVMPVTVIDIRPLKSTVEGLRFIQEDATTLAGISDQSIMSLSSLHAVEHFGLGRYGDDVDPSGWFKGMRSLARILAPGGGLYLSVPVGLERLEFNGQRVFAPSTVLNTLEDLSLVSFSAVDDLGDLRADCEPADVANAQYACGLFEFRRPIRQAS